MMISSSKRNGGINKSEQEKIVDEFNDAQSYLKFIIVTARLLTGFESTILQTMYLDKSIKNHTLLQAICRTNRLYEGYSFYIALGEPFAMERQITLG